MIRWHLTHRKQEIFGAAFALCTLAFVVARVMGSEETDATAAKNACTTRKGEVNPNGINTDRYRYTTYGDIEDASAYYNSRYAQMTGADRDSVEYALQGAYSQYNAGLADFNIGYPYEYNPITANPAGGDGYRQSGDMYYGQHFWVQAKDKYDLAVTKYNTANGYYNSAYQHYFSAQGFVSDAWDVLQNYP